MRIYTVQAPPGTVPEEADPAGWVFVKEGFCWPALFFPLLWLIYRRLWSILLVYIAAAALIGIVSLVADGPVLSGVAAVAALWFAAEANEFRRWTLRRRGWQFMGVASGRRLIDAELNFFTRYAAAPPRPVATPLAPPPARPAPLATDEPEVIGLFPAPGPHA